jgi:hypothetical protein
MAHGVRIVGEDDVGADEDVLAARERCLGEAMVGADRRGQEDDRRCSGGT